MSSYDKESGIWDVGVLRSDWTTIAQCCRALYAGLVVSGLKVAAEASGSLLEVDISRSQLLIQELLSAKGCWQLNVNDWKMGCLRGEKVWIADKCALLNLYLFQIVLLLSQFMWCETNKQANSQSPVVSRKTKKKAQAFEGKLTVWNQLWMPGIMKWKRIW